MDAAVKFCLEGIEQFRSLGREAGLGGGFWSSFLSSWVLTTAPGLVIMPQSSVSSKQQQVPCGPRLPRRGGDRGGIGVTKQRQFGGSLEPSSPPLTLVSSGRWKYGPGVSGLVFAARLLFEDCLLLFYFFQRPF